jgi:hypothetical protein
VGWEPVVAVGVLSGVNAPGVVPPVAVMENCDTLVP